MRNSNGTQQGAVGVQNLAFENEGDNAIPEPLDNGGEWIHGDPCIPPGAAIGPPAGTIPSKTTPKEGENGHQEVLETVSGRVGRDRRPWPMAPVKQTGQVAAWEGCCPPLTWISVRNVLAIAGCILEAAVLSGAIFGWASMVYVLQEDEIYLDLCDSPVQPLVTTPVDTNFTQQCPEQELRLSLAFVTGLATFGFGSFLMGVVFDRFGLRVIRLITMILGLTAFLLLAFTSKEWPWFCLLAGTILGLCSSSLIMIHANVAQLAGRRSSSLQGIFGGLLNSSFTFQAIKMAHDSGFSRRNSMLIASCVWVLGIPLSWLLPRTKVPKNYTWKEKKFFTVDGFWLSPVDQLKPIRSLKSCVFSIQFILLLMWLAILHVCWQMHTNSYNKWVTSIVHGNNDKVSFYTDLLAWVMLGSLLFAPMAGVVLDCARSKMMASTKTGQDSAPVAVAPSLILSSTVAVAMTAASLWENESAIYVCNVLFVIGKSFTYTSSVAFIITSFPTQHFGVLFGLLYSTAGLASLASYPYRIWTTVSPSGFVPLHILLLCTAILSYATPIWVIILYARHTQRVKNIVYNTKL